MLHVTGFEAIVLTGGRSSRLGGTSKADLVVAGTPLHERAVAAVRAAERVRVVGRAVRGGPVAALASALPEVNAAITVVLACDMPLLTSATVARLVGAVADLDAAMLVDDDGRRQYLAAAYRTGVLRARVAGLGSPEGASMRALVEGLRVAEVRAQPGETLDCDTWDAVRRAAALLEGT